MDKNKRDVSEALNLLDQLPPEWRKKMLVMMRLILAGDYEKLRQLCEQEGLPFPPNIENPA